MSGTLEDARTDAAGGETPVVRAEVQVGGEVTEYVRAGRGRPVLVVGDGSFPDPATDPLVIALGRRFRVLAPCGAPRESPDGREEGAWLCGLLDGLGLEGPALVVRRPGAWLREFLRRHPGRVARVVAVEGIGPPLLAMPDPGPAGGGPEERFNARLETFLEEMD